MNTQEAASTIEWRPEFETGNAAIDHEHRAMVDRINEFLSAAQSGMKPEQALELLAEILAWIAAHFALEEVMMRDHNYDLYDEHKDDHEKLLDDLRDIMDDMEANGYSGNEHQIQQQLTDWFINHFKNQDARLHSVLGH